jgi:NAD(P)-dependent dehydrogenase (short-subunit alcohol dehydrogenase family)
MRLANKTALITGGNSGTGLAIARLFVGEGVQIAITGRNQWAKFPSEKGKRAVPL